MQIYTVKSITEADYGCEETGRKEPMALLKLIEDAPNPEEKYVEVSEATLEKQKISEGKKVCFTKDGSILKYVRVVAAVIREKTENTDKIFATARGYGEYKGWWEFPGGKIEEGESPEQALVREIKEELTADIKVGNLIHTIEYDYPKFHLSMDCLWAEVVNGGLVLKEAEAARWLDKNTLDSVRWLPADLELVEIIRGQLYNPGEETVETDRLIMRRLRPEDYKVMAAWDMDERVYKYLMSSVCKSPEEPLAWLPKKNPTSKINILMLVIDKADGHAVGTYALNHVVERDVWTISYVNRFDDWGKGYATEGMKAFMDHAVNTYGARCFEGECARENVGSAKVMQKLGMVYDHSSSYSKNDGSAAFESDVYVLKIEK